MTQTIVICPDCLTAGPQGQFESSPNREGKPCWRCRGRYVLAVIPAGRWQLLA